MKARYQISVTVNEEDKNDIIKLQLKGDSQADILRAGIKARKKYHGIPTNKKLDNSDKISIITDTKSELENSENKN